MMNQEQFQKEMINLFSRFTEETRASSFAVNSLFRQVMNNISDLEDNYEAKIQARDDKIQRLKDEIGDDDDN